MTLSGGCTKLASRLVRLLLGPESDPSLLRREGLLQTFLRDVMTAKDELLSREEIPWRRRRYRCSCKQGHDRCESIKGRAS